MLFTIINYFMTLKQKFWIARIFLAVSIIFVLSLGLPSTHHQYDLQRTIGTMCMVGSMVVMVFFKKRLHRKSEV
jgi:hypothetical protein